MQIYANDNKGYFPALYGLSGDGTENGNYGGLRKSSGHPYRSNPEQWQYNPSSGRSDRNHAYNPADVSGTMYILPNDNTNNAGRAQRPARPNGLGLLLAGGYLTQSGGSVLDCPSRQFPGWWSGWMKTRLTVHPETPFYTSGGKVVLNAQMGDTDDKYADAGYYMFHFAPSALGKADWNYNFSGTHTGYNVSYVCVSDGADSDAIVPDLHEEMCWLWGSYGLRQITDLSDGATHEPEAMKVEDYAGKAVASDTLDIVRAKAIVSAYGVWHGEAVNYPDQSVSGSNQIRMSNVRDVEDMVVTNHDHAYNVLMGDGSVKTFSDSGNEILKTMVVNKLWAGARQSTVAWDPLGDMSHNENTGVCSWGLNGPIWSVYFDALYAQD